MSQRDIFKGVVLGYRLELARGSSMSFPEDDVAIWEICTAEGLPAPDEFEFVWSRASINSWQRAQRGVFTRLTHDQYLDIESYLRNRELAHYLTCYIVPGQEAYTALSDLDHMNINYATLFPDLSAAALQADIGMTIRQRGRW